MKSFFKTYGVSPEGLVLCLDQSDPRSYGDLANWYDLSPYANHGAQATAGNQPAIGGAAGLAGMTRIFDGVGDFISCGANVRPVSAISVSAWSMPHIFSLNGVIVGRSVDDGCLLFYPSGANVLFLVRVGAWQSMVIPQSDISLDTWHHFVLTYDQVNLKIFMNGVEKDSKVLSGDMTCTGNLHIGAYRTGNFFNGQIPQVQIWNRALNLGETQALYNATRGRFGK